MIPNSGPTNPIQNSAWHKKAKWMLKKVLIKPPTSENQMRELCTDIINREYGVDSRSTAVVNTAIQLWDDPALKGALTKNVAFISARERIQNLSGHILPSSSPPKSSSLEITQKIAEKNEGIELKKSDFYFKNYYDNTHNIVDCTLHAAMQCPSCGRNVHCLHDDPHEQNFVDDESEYECFDINDVNNSKNSNELDEDEGEEVNEEGSSDEEEKENEESSVAVAPRRKGSLFSSSSTCDESDNGNEHDMKENFTAWFGPLVLASLAVVGLAVGVFNGEILIPRIHNLSARSIAAVTMLMRASKSVFYALDK